MTAREAARRLHGVHEYSPLRCLPFVIVDGISIFLETHFSISNHLWRFFVSFSHSTWTMATEKYSLMEIGFFPCALHQFFFSLTKSLLLLVIEMQINGNLSLFSEHVKRQCETATKLLKNPEPCWDYTLPSSKRFFTIYLHLSRLEMFFTRKKGCEKYAGFGYSFSVSIATETFRAIQRNFYDDKEYTWCAFVAFNYTLDVSLTN